MRTIEIPDDVTDAEVGDILAHFRGVRVSSEKHYERPIIRLQAMTVSVPWICYHCGERFHTGGGAALHFGVPDDSRPQCVLRGTRRFVLHDGESEEKTEELHAFLKNVEPVDWDGDPSGVNVSIHVNVGDEMISADGVFAVVKGEKA